MSDKILAVIVPSYNMEKYLPKCLGSLVVASELMERLEVLVVNDGSKDRTSEIAHEFAAKYPKTFRVIDKINGNYGSCINAALRAATGTFVKVLDADDSVDTTGLHEFILFLLELERFSKVDVVFSDYVTVNESGAVLATNVYPFSTDEVFGMDKIADSASTMAMHAIAYRTENLRAIGYHQSEGMSYTDTEWCFEPMSTVSTARYFSKVVYRYLVGREGQTVSIAATIRSYPMYLRLLNELAVRYERMVLHLSADSTRYAQRYLDRIINQVYLTCAKQMPIGRALRAFDDLDDIVCRKYPDQYRKYEQLTFSRLFKWRYVYGLRHYGWLRLFYLLTLRTYLGVVGVVVSLRK